MNSKRVSYLMVGSLVVLVLAIVGCTYMANTMLQERAKTLAGLKVKAAVLSSEELGLAKAKKDTAKYESLETIARTIVPEDKDQTQAVREIVKLAGESGVSPSSITFPSSSLGAKTAPSAKAGAGTNLTQLTPVKGNPGLYVLPITVAQTASPVDYAKFIDFLGRLEQNRRTALVSGITLQPSPDNRDQLSFTLVLNEYIKP